MSTPSDHLAPFGTIRSILWPIYQHETKKLVTMLLLVFLICFNYTILRNAKDALVITAKGSGAEVIPFIKVWAMLPMAVFMTWFFVRLANRFNRQTVFYIMMGCFLGYFILFTFVFFPNQAFFRPDALCDTLASKLPPGASGLIAMFRNWTFTLFYTFSELWSSIVLNVLFWGFANEITALPEAKRFYGILNVGSCFAAFVGGWIAVFCTQTIYNPSLSYLGTTPWEQSFSSLILLITASSIAVIFLFRSLYRYILRSPEYADADIEHYKDPSGGKKISFSESVRYLMASKYLIFLAILVIGYNLSINLTEVSWKARVREVYPTANGFNIYLNQITAVMGLISLVTAFFIPMIVKRVGWTFMALITPVVMLTTAFTFFYFQALDPSSAIAIALGSTPLMLAVFFGGANVVLSKAAKYSVFDASKEMAFIPLSKEARLKGKATIDGVSSRLGKSGGSFIQQGLILITGSLAACAPWIVVALCIVIGLWIFSTVLLGRKFKLLSLKQVSEAKANEENSPPKLTCKAS